MAPLALGLASLLCTGVLVRAEVTGQRLLRAVSKTAASAAFIACALAGGAASAGLASQLVVLALVLSAAGDLFLLSRDERSFLAGLVAFLLAHVAFAAAFVALGVSWEAAALAGLPLLAVAFAVWRWLAPRVGSLGGPVLAYIAVISVMVALAAGVVVRDPSGARIGLAVAAVLFFLSDLCVARDRFVVPGPANRVVGLPLYYAAQVGFALAIVTAVEAP